MKKIIISLVVVAAVSAAVVGATRAWYTDSATLSGNQVITGDFAVSITEKPLELLNIGPAPAHEDSYESAGTFAVSNDGVYDMKWRARVGIQSGSTLTDWLFVKVDILPHSGRWIGNEWVNCNYGPSSGTTLFSGVPLNDLTDFNGYLLMDDPVWAFGKNYTSCYEVFIRMDPNAPNNTQNRTLEANLFVEATQRENPGWTVTE